jgi:hypothetical protein
VKGVARISFQGGALFLPVKTPYDREVLFEHLDLYAKRHGAVRVELNRREWTVKRSNGEESVTCEVCDRRLDFLTYALLGGRTLCAFCAKRDVK